MRNDPKAISLSAELHRYLVDHGTPPDSVARALIEETLERCGRNAAMQIAPEQGAFMTLLARLMGAQRAIEVGTFTGYSALCLARGLPRDGRLVCCDVSEEWTAIARRYWQRAAVADRIELRMGPAIETLRALPEERSFDLAFIDADKPMYASYYEELLLRVRVGGAILVDNVLWGGSILDPKARDANTCAIRDFNDQVAADERVETVMLNVADGLSLLRIRE